MKSKTSVSVALLGLLLAGNALAVTSAEVYTGKGYQYGRFAARMQFAPGSGVVSSFFLWKDGSEQDDVFWNELDFEKLESVCRLETNTIFGDPEELDPEKHTFEFDLCNEYHVYAYEWTPEYIAWSIDGTEIRRTVGETAVAFRDNTVDGMQLRFNVWPGDSSFGGDFDPAILPVYEYIDWVEYSAYNNGAFEVQWREDFTDGKLPSGWNTGSWDSPKGLSTHSDDNVGFMDGYIVLALTADEATGVATANPRATDTLPPPEPSASVTETSAPPATSSATATDTGIGATSAPSATTTPGVTMDPETTDAAGCSCTLGASRTRRAHVPAVAIGAALALTVSRLRRARKRNARALDRSN